MSPFLTRLSCVVFLSGACVGTARAQGEGAVEEIKAIFRLVEKDLEEIDRLLLSFDPAGAAGRMDAARKGIQKILDKAPPEGEGKGTGGESDAGKGGGETEAGGGGGSVKKVLEKAEARQSAVVNGIQRILDKVPQGKGGKSQDPKQDQKQQQQQQQRDPRGHDNPDYQQQNQPQDQQQGKEPRGNKQNPAPGANQQAQSPPPDGDKDKTNREEIDRLWGELPEYQRMQMMKKGAPPIPARYQRYFDEFIRRSNKTSGK